MLFQEPALFPWLSVVANVEFALKHVGVAQDERRTRAMSWLENVHLTGNANAQPHELSAGMRQRAVLARALACDPDVLLGDEPFGALDAQARELLQNEVQRVWVESEGRKTFVFVTHNVREAALLADRVLVMTAAPGRLLEEVRIHAPRPRNLDDALVARVVSEIHEVLMTRGQQGGVVVRRLARELGPPLAGVAGLLRRLGDRGRVRLSRRPCRRRAEVWSAFTRGVSDGTIPEAAAKTLVRLAFSFVVSIVIGTALGFGLALNEFARRSIRPLVVALQITPFIAWLPLAVVWFGLSERAVVFVAIVGAFPSVTLATISSFGQVPPLLKRAGRTLGARRLAALSRGDLPGGAPRVRRRPRSGVGVRVEGADGGRADHGRACAPPDWDTCCSAPRTTCPMLIATVAVIVVIGVLVEYLIFGTVDRRIRRKRGLLVDA